MGVQAVTVEQLLFTSLLLLLSSSDVAPQGKKAINVLMVNDEANTVGEKAVEVALGYIRRNPSLGVQFDLFKRVRANGSDAKALLEQLCAEYDSSIRADKPPHVILDLTQTGVTSETVKSFTQTLALPTVSASFGQDNDLRQWRFLTDDQLKYLIQVMPPADLIPEVIRSIVLAWNISNAGILYDDSFVMDHKYKSLLQNVPTRHLIAPAEDSRTVKRQLTRLSELDIVNFFILGRLTTIRSVLDGANANKFFGRKFAWFAITQDKGLLKSSATNATILFLKPEPDPASRERFEKLRSDYGLNTEPEIASAFYFDLTLRTFLALRKMLEMDSYPKFEYTTCEDYQENLVIIRKDLDLRKALKEVPESPSYAPLVLDKTNGHSYMEASMRLEKVTVISGQSVSAQVEGTWKLGLDSRLSVKDPTSIANLTAVSVYRIVTVVQYPFVFPKDKDANSDSNSDFQGYCIDLLEEIKRIVNFEYQIYEAPDKKFGNMDEKGQWNGMIKELMEKRADIGLGSLSVMAERENVIDFTVPYYDLVGISILMKRPETPTSLFKFLTVLENEVWMCILAAYFFTSFLMWMFDRWSPYSYQNNREKYKDDEEKREFNLKECLWFCMTSLTPQGGGEAPKNLSGRLVAATWWLFGFIIIASYTANLAAFLTVSRLDTPVESLDDLSKQYKILYAPLNGSSAMTYFQRMADIETRFYEIWKDMSLNDSLSEVERAKLAVWDYPVGDKYTKMWQAMQDAKMPNTLQEALDRVRASKTSSEGFAYLGDATDIRYLVLTNCDLQMVGEEFSRKPYAIAVQQGSPLKDQFNNAILTLLNKRKLEKLKEKWWNQNPAKMKCEKQDDQQDGISIQNIGGVFIVIFVGIGLACITLAFEYYWYKYKRNPRVSDLRSNPPPNNNGGAAVRNRTNPGPESIKLDAGALVQDLGNQQRDLYIPYNMRKLQEKRTKL